MTTPPGDERARNLIVNYVPSTLGEPALKQLFLACGPIEACKIVTDRLTGTCLGYGFVKFELADSALEAIENMNGLAIDNKRLKVFFANAPDMYSQASAELVYVSQLQDVTTEDDLTNWFGPFGKINSVHLFRDEHGASRRAGHILFAQRDVAEKAVTGLNGQVPQGYASPISVKFSFLAQTKSNGDGNRTKRRQFQQQYNTAAQYATLPQQYGAAFGQGLNMWGQQYVEGISRVAGMNISQNFIPKTQPGPNCLFVYNLPRTCNEEFLFRLLSNYGQVENVKVIRDMHKGHCKGYGFANLSRREDAVSAIQNLNGYCIEPNKPLQVKFKSQSQSY
eukprot:Rmarinus@m.24621